MSGPEDGGARPGVITCASYTHARRYPLVLGRIGGWAPPFQLSIAQIVVLMTSFGLLWWTSPLWAKGPGGLNVVVLAGVPVAASWAVRHLRVEGREPLRTLAGVASYLAASRRGSCGGAAAPPERARRADAGGVWLGRSSGAR